MPKFLVVFSKEITRAGFTVSAGSAAMPATLPKRFVPQWKRLNRYGFQVA